MADEKQLTVAELLAKSGKNSPSGEQSRPRRRRRSLEDGGVSVAELTGSIPKVNAKPVEARHSNIPLDNSTAAQDDTAAEGETSVPENADPAVEELPAEETVAAATAATAATMPAAPTTGEPKLPAEAPELSSADKFAAAKAAAIAAPITATAPSAAAPETAAGSPRVSPSHDDTQVIGAVPSAEPERREVAAGPVKTGATAAAQAAAAVVPAGLATGENPMVADLAEADVAKQVVDQDEENEGVAVGTVIGLAVVGIIFGVLVFLGFDYLWSNFNRLFVGIAALVVTVVMILGTRQLRTSNDGFSMTLAGVVGLLMTCGPALIMYLN